MSAPNHQVKEFRKWLQEQQDWYHRESHAALERMIGTGFDVTSEQSRRESLNMQYNVDLWRARAATMAGAITEMDKRFKGES